MIYMNVSKRALLLLAISLLVFLIVATRYASKEKYGVTASISPSPAVVIPTLFTLVSNPSLKKTFITCCTDIVKVSRVLNSDGALGANAAWENGQVPKWYIEEQRAAYYPIWGGVINNNPLLVQEGEQALNWGLNKQAPNGNFAGTGDPFHSTSFFIESTARSLLLMRQSGRPEYNEYVSRTVPKVELAAQWLMRPDVANKGQLENMPFTHRRYILAAALGETAALTRDKALKEQLSAAAKAYARDALVLQRPEGYNPERAGYDSAYNALGLSFATYYYTVCPDPVLRSQLREMLKRGLDWELSRMNSDGSANMDGNTRVTVSSADETDRSGTRKNFGYRTVAEDFMYGYTLFTDSAYQAMGNKIAAHERWVK